MSCAFRYGMLGLPHTLGIPWAYPIAFSVSRLWLQSCLILRHYNGQSRSNYNFSFKLLLPSTPDQTSPPHTKKNLQITWRRCEMFYSFTITLTYLSTPLASEVVIVLITTSEAVRCQESAWIQSGFANLPTLILLCIKLKLFWNFLIRPPDYCQIFVNKSYQLLLLSTFKNQFS